MNSKWWFLGMLGLFLSLPQALIAQSFEGVVKQRTVDVEGEALFSIMYGGEEEEPEFDSEAEWLRYTANKFFQIPVEQFLDGGMDGVDVTETTMYLKGTKIRMDMGPDEGWYLIYDLGAGQSWMVNPAGQFYISLSAEEAAAAAEAAERQAEEAMAAMGIDIEELQRQAEEYEGGEMDDEFGMGGAAPTVTSTGRTETINGIEASAYEGMAGDQVGLGWCAEDRMGLRATMTKLEEMAMASFMGDEEDEEEGEVDLKDLFCEDKVPVRTQVFSPSMGMDGAYSVEDTFSIEETAVSDDLFEVPAGYTKRTLEELWGLG